MKMKQPRLVLNGTTMLVFSTATCVIFIMVWIQRPIVENVTQTVEMGPSPDQTIRILKEQVEFLQKSVSGVTARIEQLSCNLKEIGTRGGFCLKPDNLEVGGNWAWDLNVAMLLEKLMENKTIGDFGAGLGWYGRYFTRSRQLYFPTARETEAKHFFNVPAVQKAMESPKKIKSWKGYDGAVFVEELTGGLVKFLDLSEPVLLPERFDWLLSMEVGEHIPQLYENNFLDNLARHACEGIVLTWAVPNQGGHNHVNNREASYVKEQMKVRGFNAQTTWETLLKDAASLPWLKNTIMVFLRTLANTDPRCQVTTNKSPA